MSNTTNTPGEALYGDFTCDFCEKGLLNLTASDSLALGNYHSTERYMLSQGTGIPVLRQ